MSLLNVEFYVFTNVFYLAIFAFMFVIEKNV